MSTQIDIPKTKLADFCTRNRIRKLSLFGSVLRDDFGPDSDVDVLVEFEHGAVVGLLDMARMERELSTIVGRKVDLKTAEDLSRYFRRQVLDLAEVLYERAG